MFLNPKLQDNDIPHKSSIARSVNAKVLHLEELTLAIVKVRSSYLNLCWSFLINRQRIPSKVSTIWDGWSTRKRRPFTSFSISFIDSPPDNDTLWELKKLSTWVQFPCGQAHGRVNWPGFGQYHPKISAGKKSEFWRLRNYYYLRLVLIICTVRLDGWRWG